MSLEEQYNGILGLPPPEILHEDPPAQPPPPVQLFKSTFQTIQTPPTNRNNNNVDQFQYPNGLEYLSTENNEEEELLDYNFIGSDNERNSDSEDDFFVDDFLQIRTTQQDKANLLFHLGNKTADELSEKEAILLRKEKLEKLLELYGSQFRRMYDILRLKHKKFKKNHRDFLNKKKAEQSNTTNPELLASLQQHKEALKFKRKENNANYKLLNRSCIMKELKKQTTLFMAEHTARKLAEQEALGRSATHKRMQRPKTAREETNFIPTKCGVEGCHMRSMRPTLYCYSHILNDTDQRLFTGCKFKLSNGAECNYPVLMSRLPPICNGHIDLITNNPKRENKKSNKKANSEEAPDQIGASLDIKEENNEQVTEPSATVPPNTNDAPSNSNVTPSSTASVNPLPLSLPSIPSTSNINLNIVNLTMTNQVNDATQVQIKKETQTNDSRPPLNQFLPFTKPFTLSSFRIFKPESE